MQHLDQFKPDNLIGGYMHLSTEQVTLKSGSFYKIGSVLAKTATGECTLVDSSTDAKTVYAILAEDIDATDAERVGVVYLSGEFNKRALVFGGSDTWEQHIDEARKLGMYFVDSSKTTIID
ncbi:head decoration protein [Gilliamella apicola]|uniref:head decoration protein n=1 Tax=Gilliamella apicola TaxID=1196095 RepID=UPI0039878D0D